MRNQIILYLSGSIKKGDDDKRKSFWSEQDFDTIKEKLSDFDVIFLNPAVRKDDVTDPDSTFGHDIFQVYASDFVLVDARDRRGIGVGIEMAFARITERPVISIVEPNTYYYRDRLEYLGQVVEPFTHPFVHSLSNSVVEGTQAAAEWIREQPICRSRNPKLIPELFLDRMLRYLNGSFATDTPMQDTYRKSESIRELVTELRSVHSSATFSKYS